MGKRIMSLGISTVVLITTLFLVIVNSDTYLDYKYSDELVNAIEQQDIAQMEAILQERPSCVNTIPTLLPKWIHILTDTQRPICPLSSACLTGNLEIVKILIDTGADVDGREQAIPLSIIYNEKKDNWYEISQLLIQEGASLDYITKYSGGKSSILQDIVRVRPGVSLPEYVTESEKVIKAFNYALENCNHSNVNWMRVLQHSVSNNRIEIVKILLDEGYCNVNDTSVGMTALMFASRESSSEMVQLLLDYGADKSYKSSDGKTAYDYAVQANNKDIISILEQGDGSVVPSE